MKALFILAMLLQLLFEGAGAVTLVLFNEKLAPDAAQSEQFLMITLGFVTLTLVIMTVLAWLQRANAAVLSYALILFATYHTLVFIGAVITATMGADISGYVAHAVLAAAFWVVWFGRSKLAFQPSGG